MSDPLDPPSKDDGAEGEPEGTPTEYEHMLVSEVGDVVGRLAGWIAKKFPRHVRKNGLMTQGDFLAIGHQALYRGARAYRDKENPDWPAFAKLYVRGAMLDAIDDLLFQERIKKAGWEAQGRNGMQHTGDDYNVMKHDEAEAKRRYRDFANGVIAATFAAAMAAAEQHLDEAELDERHDFEHARAILEDASARMDAPERELLALVYRGPPDADPQDDDTGMDLMAASKRLGITYGMARARHKRALSMLHRLLVDASITRAPRPLTRPYVGALFDSRAPPGNDTSMR